MKVFYPTFESSYVPPFRIQGKLLNTFLETPKRLKEVLRYMEKYPNEFEIIKVASMGIDNVGKIHSPKLISFYSQIQSVLGKKEYIEPITFPIRKGQKPQNVKFQAGYYCFDSRTVIKRDTLKAALNAGATTMKAALELIKDKDLYALALVRPPGHHAGIDFYGGYSFINNAAIGAAVLEKLGRVGILDLDYFHGNGTQNIFYQSSRFFTVSIHRTPKVEFPYLWGYASEKGRGNGQGWNLNIPLDGKVSGTTYLNLVEKVLSLLKKRQVKSLVVSLGTNIHKDDLWGDFDLDTDDFKKIGNLIGNMGLKVLTVLEGGYHPKVLKESLLAYLEGLYE